MMWPALLELKRQLSHAPATARILPASRRALFAALGKLGINSRDDYISFYNLVLSHQVGSTNDLTDAEARIMADFLREQGETIMEETTEQETTRTWTEAPASVNIKAKIQGYDVMLTLRGESGADVMPKLKTAIDWLINHGAAPTGFGNGGNGPAKQTAATQPATTQAPTLPDGSVDPAWCPIHQVAMKRRENESGVWYSHKVGDGWCNGKAKK